MAKTIFTIQIVKSITRASKRKQKQLLGPLSHYPKVDCLSFNICQMLILFLPEIVLHLRLILSVSLALSPPIFSILSVVVP